MYIPYNPSEFRTPGTGFHQDGLWLRAGIIQSINEDSGLVTLEWLDYPGIRADVPLSQPSAGTFDMPTIGSIVLVMFDRGYKAHIVRYLPAGYDKQIGADIKQILPGEKLLMSQLPGEVKTGGFPPAKYTGTYFHMNNSGDVEISTADGDRWAILNKENEIIQESMNYKVTTEAGILAFGLTKRVFPEGAKYSLIDPEGGAFGFGSPLVDPEALTEFRLRLLDQADASPGTDPEIDDPFIDLSLGIKVDSEGQLEKTGGTHAVSNKKIIIQLKTRAKQGFEFTVDEDGNVTMNVSGDIKMKVTGNSNVTIEGNSNIKVKGDMKVDASNVQLIGKKAVVLENFISKFNNHMHPTAGTGPPSFPIERILKEHVVSKKVKLE